MTSLLTTGREWMKSCTSAVARRLALLALVMVALCGASPAFAQKPTVDGNLTDFFNYAFSTAACGDTINDPAQDVAVFDPAFPSPCPPHGTTPFYFQNGFDETMYGFARARDGSNDLFLAMRVAGVIGDTDGNGDPSSACGGGCNLACTQTDDPNIGSNERYKWLFDTDCDPTDTRPVDLEIEVIGNAVGIYAVNNSGVRAPVAGATGTFAFNGGNLEVKVSGLTPAVLGPAFRVTNATAGSDPDGLSEDGSTQAFCQPNPQIQLEKSATPTAICVGQKTRFTLHVSNPGDVAQSVVLTDVLPAGLTYAGNPGSTCGVGAPSESPAGTLTWPTFDLAAGASCDISFDAQAAPTCFGEVVNNASVTGTFQSGCFNGGQPFQSFDKASFPVTCKALPCLELTATGPESQCAGRAVTISGTVKNCSLADETIVVKVNGVQAFNAVVAAGATQAWSLPTTMPAECTKGSLVPFQVEATATNECSTDTKNTVVNVRCDARPCVELTAAPDKQAACPGEGVVVSGTVKNCAVDPEQVVITVNGQQVFNQAVAAGVTVQWSAQVSMPADCQANAQVPFVVVATATNDCGEDVKQQTVNVRCKGKPCVELTANRDPASACPGDAVTISGTVKNCSTEPETIVVTVNGEQVFSALLQPNETQPYSKSTVMPACTAGQSSDWTVVATASGDCPPNDVKQQVVSVQCKNPPCVDVTAETNKSAACPNEEVIISGTVTNCGKDSATYTVTVGGVQVFSGELAGGASQPYQRTVSMGECTAGNNVSWTVVAHATNSCGEDNEEKSVSVRCKDKPCVELTADREPASACPGDAVTISGTVKNCSLEPETIVVTVNDEQVFSALVQPGVTQPYSKSTVMPACTAGGSVTWNIQATASGDCPPNDVKNTSVSVTCKNPPCADVTAQANKTAACPNEEVVISGIVTNCGKDSATYTVTVGGVQVFSGELAGGASQPYQRTVSMGECTAGNNVSWTVVATASNSCGQDTDEKTVSVRCKDKPCVELTANREPTSACPGDKVTISGTVKNCSLDPEVIVVTINGEQVFNATVQPGATQQYSKSTVMPACTAGAEVTWNIVATASGDCPPNDVKNTSVSVTCKTPPCVETRINCSPEHACPGTPITVTGYAKNCSTVAEKIDLTVAGETRTFNDVQPGQEVSFEKSLTMPECTEGQQVEFHASSVASTDCGTTDPAPASCSIRCDNPQIDVEKSVDPQGEVEQGTTLHYTITVTNPSKTVALTDVKVTDTLCDEVTYQNNANVAPTSAPAVGSSGTIVWDIPSIAAGGSVTLTFDAKVRELASPDCERDDRECTNRVEVVGYCGTAEARDSDSVRTPIKPCERPGLCRFTGGGCLNEKGNQKGHKQNTFGGNVSPCREANGGPSGNSWEHIYRDGREILFNWHSWDPCVTACSVVEPGPCHPKAEFTRVDFEGPGKYSIGAGGREEDGNMVAYIIDHREGACNRSNRDEYFITVREGSVIGQGKIVFQTGGEIDCGNLQVHDMPSKFLSSGTQTPGVESGEVAAVTLLNKAYPNPFSGQTTFAYRVPEAGANVSVGIYNVAGRLVKTLAAGSQNAGTYTVTWDGSGDSGIRMAPGVYFLRSQVGPESVVNRIIYVAR